MPNKRFIFVGEKRSRKAVRMAVTWRDGRLAAKQLFDALHACGLSPQKQRYINLFVGSRVDHSAIRTIRASKLRIVAMGQKVQSALSARDIAHVPIVHPAARGLIRRKDRYIQHVKEALC